MWKKQEMETTKAAEEAERNKKKAEQERQASVCVLCSWVEGDVERGGGIFDK